MKKTVLFAAAALIAAACNNAPKVETTVEDFNAWAENYAAEVQNKLAEMDSTLAEDSKESLMAEYNESAYKAYVDHIKDVIKANNGNEVSLEGLKAIYYELDLDERQAALDALDDSLAEDQFVVTLRKAVDAQQATAVGKMFTDFEVEQDPEGNPGVMTKFSEYVGTGKYMLVDFWASWCGPCKREIPNIKSVYEKYHGDNFDVLSVAVWDDPKASVDTAAAYGVNWNHIVNAQRIPTEIYGIQGIPHIILVGPDGTILKRDLRGEDIEKAVAECLK